MVYISGPVDLKTSGVTQRPASMSLRANVFLILFWNWLQKFSFLYFLFAKENFMRRFID